MTLDYYTKLQIAAFKDRCRQAGVTFTLDPSVKGDIVTFTRKGKKQKYLIPLPAFDWMPTNQNEIPLKLNNFLDQFLAEVGP